VTTFPDIEKARICELQVDEKLVYNQGKINAFANDTNCGTLRDFENLAYIKQILGDFGRVSGLETNVEKTTLMPIGRLNEQMDPRINGLGFCEMKTLGIVVNNTGTELWWHFDEIIQRLVIIASKWDRLKLSLVGMIAISKTMLVSQIGYGAAILTPTADQPKRMQEIVNNYVLGGIPVARERLYTKQREGGLGLINLETYCMALQCSWIKRCTVSINPLVPGRHFMHG